LLFSVIANISSDELEIISFSLKTEEFFRKKLRINKILTAQDIRFVVIYTAIDSHKLFIIAVTDTCKNYFFNLNYHDGKVTELPIAKDVGIGPSFQKLNDRYLIAFGGVDSDTVNLYDIIMNNWTYVGKMTTVRNGGYALFNDLDGVVYIAGGVNNENDNSLNIDYFIINLEEGDSFQIKSKKLKDDFLLKKSNPVVIPVYDYNTYLICGGESLFGDVNTCSIFYLDKDMLLLSSTNLPKPFSTTNKNFYTYKSCVYFFISHFEVIKFNSIDNTYNLIKKEILNITTNTL
jgi:hypothetical protein